MASTVKARSLFDPADRRGRRSIDSFRKLTPRRQVRNPVMFVVYVGSILTTLLWVQALVGKGEAPAGSSSGSRSGSGSPCCSPTSPRRWRRAAARPRRRSLRKARRDLQAKRLARAERGRRRSRSSRPSRAPQGRHASSSRPATSSPPTASRRGRRLGQRGGHHRRERAGDPRERAAIAARSPAAPRCSPTGSSCEVTANPGRGLPRPDDRAGRGGQAAEDARTRSRSTSCSRR